MVSYLNDISEAVTLRCSATNRSSRSWMFFKIGVLKSFAIFTAKHLTEIFTTIAQKACSKLSVKAST